MTHMFVCIEYILSSKEDWDGLHLYFSIAHYVHICNMGEVISHLCCFFTTDLLFDWPLLLYRLIFGQRRYEAIQSGTVFVRPG